MEHHILVDRMMTALQHVWLSWDVIDFSFNVYGFRYQIVDESQQAYLLDKHKIFKQNPIKLYCDLDLNNQRRFHRALGYAWEDYTIQVTTKMVIDRNKKGS